MNYRKLISPSYCFDKAFAKVWKALASDLPNPGRDPQVDSQMDWKDFSIEWPNEYGWGPGFNWVGTIRSGLSRYIDVCQADIAQLPNTAVMIKLFFKGREHKVIIDYNDQKDSIFNEYLDDCLIYFKLQYQNEGYDDPRIVPGFYVPSAGMDMYRYLSRLRRIRDDSAHLKFEVYGRFGLYKPRAEAKEDAGESSWHEIESDVRDIRSRAIEVLMKQKEFSYQGGGKLIYLSKSLCEVARSKVCIDLPGRGPFCYRLVDYMSIGSCIVAYPHGGVFDPPLIAGKHIVYCKPDLSDLVDICQYYLTHDKEREDMVQASREYFDTHLHKDCLGAYYLERIAAQLNKI